MSVLVKRPGESLRYLVSFDALLEPDELITGDPNVTASPDGLTITEKAANAAEETLSGVTVPIGRGVVMRIEGGTAGVVYTLHVTVETDAGNTRSDCFRLVVDEGCC